MDVYRKETIYSVRPNTGLYRDMRRKVFTGVCAGIGRHFDIKPNWIRIGFIIAFAFTAPLPLVVYIAATFLMPKDYDDPSKCSRRSWRRSRRSRKYNDEHDGDNYASNYTRRRVSIEDVIHKFDEIDRKVRSMEDVVTSKEFTLRQKFRNLKD